MSNAESRIMESERQFITIPRRGLKVIAPKEVSDVMERAQEHKRQGTKWSNEEKQNLWSKDALAEIHLLKSCPVLRDRYPDRESGAQFMQGVDNQRRKELFDYSIEMSQAIVNSWEDLNPQKPIAVVLFGSVAKGLVKSRFDSDPSNIDIAVIGHFTENERLSLFDNMREKRDLLSEKIRSECPNIDRTIYPEPGNVGVHVQHISKLQTDLYGNVRSYIASGAIALHDPAGIWADLKQKGLFITHQKMERTKKSNRGKLIYR